MTATAAPAPRTAVDVLFGPGADDAVESVIRQVASNPGSLSRALEGLPKATRDAAVHQVAAATAGLLNVELIELIADGWRKYQNLVAAARRTLAAPDSVELVEPASHTITAQQQPYVSVLVDDRQVAVLNIRLSIEFEISALIAEIRAGRLVAVKSGHCDVTATLEAEGVELETRKAQLELPGVIGLGHGIRLLPVHDYPHPEASGSATAKSDGPEPQMANRRS
jgi:hypothetical protein